MNYRINRVTGNSMICFMTKPPTKARWWKSEVPGFRLNKSAEKNPYEGEETRRAFLICC